MTEFYGLVKLSQHIRMILSIKFLIVINIQKSDL